MGTKAKGYLLAITTSVTFGMIPLFAIPLKQIDFSFDNVLFYRFGISALMIGAFLLYKKVDLRISLKEFATLILLGVVYSFSSEFLFLGYDYMPAGVASTILFMYPILVALIMGLGFGERLSWVVWVAILLAFVGVGVLNGGPGGDVSTIGVFIVFISALAYAVYMVMVNKSCVKGMQGMKVTFYSIAVSAIFFFCKALIGGSLQFIPSAEVGINLIFFALITTVISLITLVYAIKFIGSTPTAIMGSLEPMVAVAISVLLFNEAFTLNLMIGIILIMGAVVLTVLSDSLQKWLSRKKIVHNIK